MTLSPIQLRRDIKVNWETVNPVLRVGEPGFEIDTNILKIGDGGTAWNDLPGIVAGGGGATNLATVSVTTGNEQRPSAAIVFWYATATDTPRPTGMGVNDLFIVPTVDVDPEPEPGGTAPTITTTTLGAMKVGVAYNQVINYTGDTVTGAAVTSGVMPPGLSLTVNAGVIRIQGTPTAAQGFSVGITATNPAGSDFQAFGGTIDPADVVTPPVTGHSVFGTTTPAETYTAYTDGSDTLVANQFYTYGSPAYTGINLVGIRIFVPAGTPSGALTVGGIVTVATPPSANNGMWAPDANLATLEAALRNPANHTPFTTLTEGWNTITLNTPVPWEHGKGFMVGYRFANGNVYFHAPTINNSFTPATDGYRLVRSDSDGPVAQRGAAFNTNIDSWSDAYYAVDVVLA